MMGLRGRFILYFAIALVALLAASSAFGFQAVRRARGQAFSQQIHLTRTIAAGLERELGHVRSDVETYLPEAPAPDQAQSAATGLLDHLAGRENLGYFRVSGVRLVDARGTLLAAAPAGLEDGWETLPAGDAVGRAISSGLALFAPSRLHVDGRPAFLSIVVPLQGREPVPGGTAVVVDTVGRPAVDLFSTAVGDAPEQRSVGDRTEGGYEVEVLRADGAIVATSESDELLGAVSYHRSVMSEFMARREAGAIVHRPENGDHPQHIAAIVPVRDTPFFLVTEEPLGALLDWPQQLRTQTLTLGGTAVLVVVALGWIVNRQIVRPVAALRRATAGIRGGDLENPVRVSAGGELATLVEEVELMRERLQDTVSSLDRLNRSLADQVLERTEQLRRVVGRLMQAQEEERRRVARDLHDETAQGLTALGIILDGAALEAEGRGEAVPSTYRTAREQVRRLVAETRRLAYALRPTVLDDAGIVPALRWCAEAYLEAVGVQVAIHAPEAEVRLPEPVEVSLFRVAQEAMSNIARHARATHVWVTLERAGGWVTLAVKDDGVGFEAGGPPNGHHMGQVGGIGLAGMSERVDLLGGTLEVISRPGEGTTVTARVPTDRDEEA